MQSLAQTAVQLMQPLQSAAPPITMATWSGSSAASGTATSAGRPWSASSLTGQLTAQSPHPPHLSQSMVMTYANCVGSRGLSLSGRPLRAGRGPLAEHLLGWFDSSLSAYRTADGVCSAFRTEQGAALHGRTLDVSRSMLHLDRRPWGLMDKEAI